MKTWVERLNEVFIPDGEWIEPLSDRWWQARRGRISASSRAVTLATRKGGPWSNLMVKLENELRPDYVHHQVQGVGSLDWGNNHELKAIANIELHLGVDLVEPGMLFHPEHPYCEATPDSLLDDKITVQIKCPMKPEFHLAVLHNGKSAIKRNYFIQTQFEAWIAAAESAMFVSFDPRQRQASQLAIVELPIDRALHDAWEENVPLFRTLFEADDHELAIAAELSKKAKVIHKGIARPIGVPNLF